MSNVTRGLTASVLAAMRGGQANTHMEDDPEKDNPAEELENKTTDPDAEGEETDPDAEGEGAPGDDPEGEDKQDTSANRSARAAERSRIQAILTHPKAEANADLASHLAFKTAYSAKEAMAILDASSPSASTGGNRLAGRMAGKTPKLGAGGAPSAQSEKQSLLAAVGGVINARHGRPTNGE
ncbi:hypothetical protein [Martelella mediterranea]|uniref:Uncharacterized protein n=1 Tax=Martelella mediterranea TaxID=293089 RepID=A0A4R3NK39_9HYPH|nr:hypothetical protein [Martelella mediterranea]TCT34700.1 hypothetical protein EDC90_103241 [Martelella mediterranea]